MPHKLVNALVIEIFVDMAHFIYWALLMRERRHFSYRERLRTEAHVRSGLARARRATLKFTEHLEWWNPERTARAALSQCSITVAQEALVFHILMGTSISKSARGAGIRDWIVNAFISVSHCPPSCMHMGTMIAPTFAASTSQKSMHHNLKNLKVVARHFMAIALQEDGECGVLYQLFLGRGGWDVRKRRCQSPI